MKKIKTYSVDDYSYNIDGNTIEATSSYAGNPVVGRAKCHESDEYDVFRGKAIAAARCNLKIAERRFKRATAKVDKVNKEMLELSKKIQKAGSYYYDSLQNLKDAKAILESALKEA